ncbi:MAG TPA: hypothetical protein VGA98_03680 [Allosphingosinicella sp.]|jgi:hypothetical protein
MLTCTPTRPWGIHPALRSDEDCPRCGWTAPGPVGNAFADALAAAEEARAWAAEFGWGVRDAGEALAA